MRLVTYARLFLVIGLIFGFIQNKYYGYMDDDGVIHDSWFMPLSFIFIAIGIVLFAFIAGRFIYNRYKN
jgi:xanthine/uracil permease